MCTEDDLFSIVTVHSFLFKLVPPAGPSRCVHVACVSSDKAPTNKISVTPPARPLSNAHERDLVTNQNIYLVFTKDTLDEKGQARDTRVHVTL